MAGKVALIGILFVIAVFQVIWLLQKLTDTPKGVRPLLIDTLQK